MSIQPNSNHTYEYHSQTRRTDGHERICYGKKSSSDNRVVIKILHSEQMAWWAKFINCMMNIPYSIVQRGEKNEMKLNPRDI